MRIFNELEIVDDQGRHHVPDMDLVQLAEEIMDCYITMRPSYAPGRVTIPKKTYIKFYRAAELCREREQSPAEFVKLQLEGMARTGNFWPSAIANTEYAERVVDQDVVDGVTASHYKSQLLCYGVRSKIYGPRETIEDLTISFTPLFRTVIAYELGLADIVDHYLNAALLELEATPAARKIFDGYLGFADARSRIHRGSHQHFACADDPLEGDSADGEISGADRDPPSE